MSTVTFAPLFRSSIGFDRFSDLFETALRSETGSSYPPYNVEKHGDDDYRIVVAASGFAEGDLDIQVEKDVLTISSGRREAAETVQYLHQGIAQRALDRKSVVAGQSVSLRVDHVGRRRIKKKT